MRLKLTSTIVKAFIILALGAANVYAAAPTLDISGSWANASGTSATEDCSVTPTGVATIVVMAANLQGAAARTWLTPVASGLTFTSVATSDSTGTGRYIQMWYAPNASASAHSITVTVAASQTTNTWLHCIALTGADTSAPLQASNSGYEDTRAAADNICSASNISYGSDVYVVGFGMTEGWSASVDEGTDVAWVEIAEADTGSAGGGSWELETEGYRANGTSYTGQVPWNDDAQSRPSICIAASFKAGVGGGSPAGASSLAATGVQ